MNECMYACMYASVYVCMYTCIHVYIFGCIHSFNCLSMERALDAMVCPKKGLLGALGGFHSHESLLLRTSDFHLGVLGPVGGVSHEEKLQDACDQEASWSHH